MDKINAINTINLNINNNTNNTNYIELNNKDINKIKIDNGLIINDIKKIDKKELSNNDSKEIILDNLSFGFNSETKDFYVKVKRGNLETQYPTDEMMKLKSFLQNLNQN